MKTNLRDQCGKVAMPFLAVRLQVNHAADAAHVTDYKTQIELCATCATTPVDLRKLVPSLEALLLKTNTETVPSDEIVEYANRSALR